MQAILFLVIVANRLIASGQTQLLSHLIHCS